MEYFGKDEAEKAISIINHENKLVDSRLKELEKIALGKQELYKALSLAQAEMESAKKTSSNPYFKSRYSDLATVWDAIKGPITKQGLCVTQTFDYEGDRIILITTLAHLSGQTITSRLPLIIQKIDPQGLGSAITYHKRYALQAILCLPSEDDDGEQSMTRASEDSLKELKVLINGDKEIVSKILNAKKIKSLAELSASDVETYSKTIKSRAKSV